MEILRAIGAFVLVVVVALILGRLEHHKEPSTHCYACLGALAVLLLYWRWM